MPDFGIMRGFNEKLFGDKLVAGQLPTQLGLIGSESLFIGLLDTYPNAAAAYSLRQLRLAYTGNAIRVRRSSDNAEQNIAFTALGDLDTTALTTFCSGTNGFVTTWYDQSGNARNATQSTAANQPQIVSSGSVINVNSKPSLKFDGTNDNLSFTYQWANQTFDFLSVLQVSQDKVMSFLAEGGSSGGYLGLGTGSTGFPGSPRFALIRSQINVVNFSSLYSNNVQYLTNYFSNNGIVSALLNASFKLNNGTTQNINNFAVSNTNSNSVIGSAANGDFINGNMQELVLYSSNQSTNKTGIATNINTYYAIY